jgi:hypothetical protein
LFVWKLLRDVTAAMYKKKRNRNNGSKMPLALCAVSQLRESEFCESPSSKGYTELEG